MPNEAKVTVKGSVAGERRVLRNRTLVVAFCARRAFEDSATFVRGANRREVPVGSKSTGLSLLVRFGSRSPEVERYFRCSGTM